MVTRFFITKWSGLLAPAILVLTALLAPLSHAAGPPQQGTAEWTIMMYSVADDEILEEDMLIDILEAQLIGSTADVNIVAQIDRYDGAYDGLGDWTGTRRYYLTANEETEFIGSEEVGDLGEVNMSDSAVLIEFIDWAVENYPAEKYALIMSDHGAGWPGGFGDPNPGVAGPDQVAAIDLVGGHDGIFLMELDEALGQARQQNDIDQFEFVGFDACLMAELEVFTAIAPHARYSVASEETEPALGWSYAAFLEQLVNSPQMDGAGLGQAIVETYIDQDVKVVLNEDPAAAAQLFGADMTLSAVDLSAIGQVNSALDEFVTSLLQIDQNQVAEARAYAQSYESIFGQDIPSPQIDLGHFAQLVKEANPTVQAEADALLAAIETAVVAEKHGPERPGSTGIAIHFPVPQIYNTQNNFDYNIIAQRFVDETLWDEFLAAHLTDSRRDNFSRPQAQPAAQPAPAAEIEETDTIPGIESEEDLEILIEDIEFLAEEGYTAEEAIEIMLDEYGWPVETIDFLIEQGVFGQAAAPARTSVAKPIQVAPLTLSAEIATPDAPVVIQTEISGDRVGYIFSFIGRFLPREDVLIIEDMDYIFADEFQEIGGVSYPAWPEESFTVNYEWEPIIFAIDDGESQVRALFEPETYDELPTYAVEGIYTFAQSGDTRFAKLFFRDDQLVSVFGFTGAQNNGLGAPRQITPKTGDTFTVLERGFDLNEDTDDENYSREGGVVTFGDTPLTLEAIPAPSGNYVIGIIAEDLDGNSYEQYEGLFVVSDETEAVDGFVPYVSDEFEFALLHPEAWGVEEDPDNAMVLFGDEETGTVLLVQRIENPEAATPGEANEEAIQAFIEVIEQDGELENLQFITEEAEDFVLGAFDGKILEFAFDLDEVPFYSSIVVATPVTGVTYGLLALVPDENFDLVIDDLTSVTVSFDVLISGVSKEQIGPPPPEIDAELFVDDFSDPDSGLIEDEEAQDWGRGYYAGAGQYVFEMNPDPGAIYDYYLLDEPLPDEFLLEVTASYTGAIDNAYGLIFQVLPAETEDEPDRFYTFRISGDGFYTVEKAGDDLTPLIDWTYTNAINQGEQLENNLAVQALGDDSYSLYINGQQVDTFTDAPPAGTGGVTGGPSAQTDATSYNGGLFGLVVDNFDPEFPATFRFDDLIVGTPVAE